MAAVIMEWESRLGRRLRIRDIYILATAVKCGSMAKAARQLAMSQPSVSEAIANLEHVLRVRLLDRGSQGIASTIYADALLKRGKLSFEPAEPAANPEGHDEAGNGGNRHGDNCENQQIPQQIIPHARPQSPGQPTSMLRRRPPTRKRPSSG